VGADRDEPVVGPQGEDASGSQLPGVHARVISEAVGGQVLMVRRVKRGSLARDDGDEDIVRSSGGGCGRGASGSGDGRLVRFEPPVDGLDGVMHCGLDDGQIQKPDWAGTRRGCRRQCLHGNDIPVRHDIGAGREWHEDHTAH